MISRLVLVVLFLFCTSELCNGAPFAQTTVNIKNALDTPLALHCKSKEDDLGSHTLLTGQSFTIKFKVNILVSTLFFCHFQWIEYRLETSHWFNIFDAESKKTSKCRTCNWEITSDGPCRQRGEFENKICFYWPEE